LEETRLSLSKHPGIANPYHERFLAEFFFESKEREIIETKIDFDIPRSSVCFSQVIRINHAPRTAEDELENIKTQLTKVARDYYSGSTFAGSLIATSRFEDLQPAYRLQQVQRN
jgi:hypothetical protein